jgi:hypothetical protein
MLNNTLSSEIDRVCRLLDDANAKIGELEERIEALEDKRFWSQPYRDDALIVGALKEAIKRG